MANWELTQVSNWGEMKASLNSEEIVVAAKPLITDIKSKLLFVPKDLKWTVGWSAYVWQEKESGRFKDLTEDEYERWVNEGIIHHTRDDDGSDSTSADARADEASPTE